MDPSNTLEISLDKLGYRLLNAKHDTHTFVRLFQDNMDYIYIDTVILQAWKVYKNKRKGIEENMPLNFVEMKASINYLERIRYEQGR